MKTAVYFEHNFPTWKTMILGAFLGLSVASCADQNFDWESAKQQNPEYTFRNNFEKLVGKIDPNQTWDFSTSANVRNMSTRASSGLSTVNASSLPADAANSLITLLSGKSNKNGEEGKNHENLGQQFTITSTGDFVVCPTWHGTTTLYNLIVTGVNPNTRESVVYTIPSSEVITTMGYSGANATDYIGTNTTQNAPKGWVIPFDAGYIITFELQPIDQSGNPIVTDQKSSAILMNHNLAPYAHKHDYSEYILLDDYMGDKDYNDLVLLVYAKGDYHEPEITPADNQVLNSKRYMVEDLGSTSASDIDFNDIVIDLSIEEYGDMVDQTYVKRGEKQYAIVRAAGGTMDFEFIVNDEVIFRKSAAVDYRSMVNTYKADIEANGYDVKIGEKIEISGWDPTTNNVKFRVAKTSIINMLADGGVIYDEWKKETETFSFPEPGETPYIMAFDITKEWRDERHPICSHFLEDLEGTEECEVCGGKSDYKQ